MSDAPTALVKHERPALEFTSEQEQILRDSFLSGASAIEQNVLIQVAQRRRLDPFKGQIHFVKRWDAAKEREVWSFQTGIDGLRAQAEDTGLYDGKDEPEFSFEETVNDKGQPTGNKQLVARVRIYRKDIKRPFCGVARFNECVQTKRNGETNYMWRKRPHGQLEKCAEAIALRMAFPAPLGGLHTDAEMGTDEIVSEAQAQDSRIPAAPIGAAPAAQAAAPETDEAREARLAAALRAAPDEDAATLIGNEIMAAWPDKDASPRKRLHAVFKEQKKAVWSKTAAKAPPAEPPADREPGAEG